MRKAPGTGKKYGYIILPVCIPSTKVAKYNDYIDSDPQFKGIWRVIKALRAHDESLVDEAEFRRKITVITGGGKKGGGEGWKNENLPLDFPDIPLDAVTEAVYAAVPKKLGDREYWSQWARDVAVIADRLIARIKSLLEKPKPRKAFDSFLKGLRENLNPTVGEEEATEMLAQHIITRPVFEALFDTYSFTTNNPVSSSMQKIVELLDAHEVDSETESLEKFYANVRDRVSLAKSEKSRQDIIRNLYDTFFGSAFPRVAERLGIVYTPVEVVDFIVQSVEVALQRHFKASMSDSWVQMLDPFTGTGTFPVRLLQSGLIKPEDLKRKFQNELHANEIVLLAYYIATINIESAYYGLTGEHLPFEGIVLTDTFHLTESVQGDVEAGFSLENSERANRQKKQPIRVIFSNPPYSVNNNPVDYKVLDESIEKTYAARSTASNKNSIYDSYIRAIRWATDRIKGSGIVAFVTNGAFIDGDAADGIRQCLTEDFSHLYILNLRGDQRTQGEQSKKEGGKIFGSGSRTPVAISIMVKDPAHSGPAKLHYCDIGDYLTREEKLARLEDAVSIAGVTWTPITPNKAGDWAEQRSPEFDGFLAMGDKESSEKMFSIYSNGLKTNRDPWVHSYSKVALEGTVKALISNTNAEADRYDVACAKAGRGKPPELEQVVSSDPKKVSRVRRCGAR
jgi:predicted helicase